MAADTRNRRIKKTAVVDRDEAEPPVASQSASRYRRTATALVNRQLSLFGDHTPTEPLIVAERVPIAVRAWCEPVPKSSDDAAEPSDDAAETGDNAAETGDDASEPGDDATEPDGDRNNYRPSRFIAIRPAPEGTALAAVALVGDVSDCRPWWEMLIYEGDEPAAELKEYVKERSRPHTNGRRYTGEGSIELMSLADFHRVFRSRAYRKQHLVIGHDLPAAIARISTGWREVERGKTFVRGWAFCIGETQWWDGLADKDGKPIVREDYKPRRCEIFVKPLTRATGSRISGGVWNKGRYARGQCLDLRTFAYSLSAETYTLHSAVSTFCPTSSGSDETAIDAARREARELPKLARALIEIFDRWPVSRANGGKLSECRIYSPAGLTRALAYRVGLGAPEVPRNRLGPTAAANYGGWTETAVRGFVPVVCNDFSKQYATVAALLRIEDFLAHERIAFVEATADARALAEQLDCDGLTDPTVWPGLRYLCWCLLRGEVVPVTADFSDRKDSEPRFSLGMVERYSDGRLVPLMLPDVLASKLLGGKGPEIVRAERLEPIARRETASVELPSGAVLDPGARDIYCTLAEEGERLRRGDGQWAELPQSVREALYPGNKVGNNGLAYGSPAMTYETDLPGKKVKRVSLLYDGDGLDGEPGEMRQWLRHPEEPGPLTCFGISALVTAGGRLLQAMGHRKVRDRGGLVAYGDTDSNHIVATETGGPVTIGNDTAQALSFAAVAEIRESFRPLNPFDPTLFPGSPLKDEGAGTALIVADKRYALLADRAVQDATASVLGAYCDPTGRATDDWVREAWQWIAATWRGNNVKRPDWFALPAVREMTATQPEYWERVKLVVDRPFGRFLIVSLDKTKTDTGHRRVAMAPFCADPCQWQTLPWIYADTGEPIAKGEKFTTYAQLGSQKEGTGRFPRPPRRSGHGRYQWSVAASANH